MAFQKGSQVRPELMRGDMSGFAQAAQFKAQEGQMWGQALQNVGEQIAGAVKQKQAKDEKKAKDEAAINVLITNGIPAAAAKAAVGSGMADTILAMSQQDKKMQAQAKQDAATAAHRASVLQGQGDQLKVSQDAEARLKAASTTAQGIAERGMALKEKVAQSEAIGDTVAADQAKAELRKTQMETAKIVAQTDDIGKGAKNYDVKLLETEVGDVTFADYLQELTQTKKIKGGELHQKGLLNFDEDQIAAFDNILRNNTKFLKGMPKAVQDYYGYTDTPGGGSLRITKR
jgi:hypothetical protein